MRDARRVQHVVVQGVHVGRSLQANGFLIETGCISPIAQLAIALRKIACPDSGVPRSVRLAGQTQGALQVGDGCFWIPLHHISVAGFSEGILQVILGAGAFVLCHALQMNLKRTIVLTQIRVADRQVAPRQGV